MLRVGRRQKLGVAEERERKLLPGASHSLSQRTEKVMQGYSDELRSGYGQCEVPLEHRGIDVEKAVCYVGLVSRGKIRARDLDLGVTGL